MFGLELSLALGLGIECLGLGWGQVKRKEILKLWNCHFKRLALDLNDVPLLASPQQHTSGICTVKAHGHTQFPRKI